MSQIKPNPSAPPIKQLRKNYFDYKKNIYIKPTVNMKKTKKFSENTDVQLYHYQTIHNQLTNVAPSVGNYQG